MKNYRMIGTSVALLAAGILSASAVAGRNPASILQTGTTTTGTTETTGTSARTGTTATTVRTTVTTTVATTTTTTVRRPRRPVFVIICHHAPPANAQRRRGTVRHITLRIPSRALRAHVGSPRGHGDSLGACTSQRARTLHSSKAHVKRWHPGRTLKAELRARKRP